MTQEQMWALGGALMGFMHGMHERGKGATWRMVFGYAFLGLVAGVMLHSLLDGSRLGDAMYDPNAVPQDHFG